MIVSANDVHHGGKIRAVLKNFRGWPYLSYVCDNCGESHKYLHQFSNQKKCPQTRSVIPVRDNALN